MVKTSVMQVMDNSDSMFLHLSTTTRLVRANSVHLDGQVTAPGRDSKALEAYPRILLELEEAVQT